MYEGDTMTQIFKRTKKCCAKLIRKLTFNAPSPVNIPIKLRSTNASQCNQQKSRTCLDDNLTQIAGSPTNSFGIPESPGRFVETGWDLAGTGGKLSTIKGCSHTTSCNNNGCRACMLSHGEAEDDDDYQMFHISPRFFLKRDTTMSYMRVGDDGGGGGNREMGSGGGNGGRRNCNFTPRLGMTNLMASMILSRRDLGKWNKSQNNNSCCSDDEIVTNMKDGSSEVYGPGRDYMAGTNGSVETGANDPAMGKKPIGRNEEHTRPQKTHFGLRKDNANTTFDERIANDAGTLTTSFMIQQNAADNRIHSSKAGVERSASCCRSIASDPIEITNRTNKGSTKDESAVCTQIVFEKVKYDKSKRYLRHTPSESSAVSSPRSARSSGRLLSRDASISSSFSLDDNSFSDNNLYSSSSPSHSLCSNRNRSHIENGCCFDSNGNCCHLSIIDGDSAANPSEKDINHINSLGCREHCETWDSNGNSADSRRILCEEAWNVFENKVNTARDKKMMILYTEDAEDFIRSSSPRSSSTTLETWIDDEIFDNSFNEELERHHRHCASSLQR